MYMSIFGGEKWKDFHPGGFWGVRKWRILCFISANSPSGVGGRFFRARVNFFELPGTRKGGQQAQLLLARHHPLQLLHFLAAGSWGSARDPLSLRWW